MHQAFSDDSMSLDGDKTLLLAACVQKYSAWADFSVAWESALALPPSINYFKMREARSLTKEFQGWKPADRDAKIKLLVRVMVDYHPQLVTAWISRKEFDEIVKPVIPYMVRHPYIPLFYALIISLAEWQHGAGMTIPTDFVFDEQGSVGAEAVIWYAFMKSTVQPHIAALMGSTPVFRDDKFILPLQGADIAAWHERRVIDYPHENKSSLPTAELGRLSCCGIHLNKTYLTQVATEMARVPNIELAQVKPKDYIPGKLPEENNQ